jgi:hypothetical protein
VMAGRDEWQMVHVGTEQWQTGDISATVVPIKQFRPETGDR